MNKQFKQTVEFALTKIHFVVVPVVLCTLIAVFVAMFGSRNWSASQALFVRDDGIGSEQRGGRFDSVDMMQVSQETILEIVQQPTVLKAALLDVGPDGSAKKWLSFKSFLPLPLSLKNNWPSNSDVEDLAAAVSIKSPKGTQFGRTEVIYVNVKAKSPERAGVLAKAVSEQLGVRMMKLREERYTSVADEWDKSVTLAKSELKAASQRLRTIEKQLGTDLTEIRVMMDGGTGEGTVRRVVVQLEGELRGAKAAYMELQNQIQQLAAAIDNPTLMLSLPFESLNNQPNLRRLKEGLSEAQLRTSTLLGSKSPSHPDVLAAKQSEVRVAKHLHKSLIAAVSGMNAQLTTVKNRVANVERQLTLANGRMGGIAGLRTEYSTLNAMVTQRMEFLKTASDQLAIARGNALSARSVSLILLVDNPIVGSKPIGPGGMTTVLCGAMAGFMIGGSLIFLMLPVTTVEGPKSEKSELGGRGYERRFSQPLPAPVANQGERRSSGWPKLGRRVTDYQRVQPGVGPQPLDN